MNGDYSVERILSDDLVVLRSLEYGSQMWTPCKVRKATLCLLCGEGIEKNVVVFRPLTNGGNRMERIHPSCLKSLAKGAGKEPGGGTISDALEHCEHTANQTG